MDEPAESPNGRLTLHANILAKAQRSALKAMAGKVPPGFYLAGGTAVALHIGHRRKFSVADPGHLLFALAYFDDAEKDPMPPMLWPVGWPEIKKAIRAWVRAF